MQRRPDSSLRPNHSEARRCGQNSSTRPMRPWLSRKPTKRSPRSWTRTGGRSGSGSSRARNAGIQYRRNTSPIGVPGPVLVTSSLSSRVSITRPPPLATVGARERCTPPDCDHPPIGGARQETSEAANATANVAPSWEAELCCGNDHYIDEMAFNMIGPANRRARDSDLDAAQPKPGTNLCKRRRRDNAAETLNEHYIQR